MKNLLPILFAILSLTTFAQTEFPYQKLLSLSEEELLDAKFKYDKLDNQYVLKKSNGLQVTANVLGALAGTTADMKPHIDDYIITIQLGDKGIAYINVLYYNPDTYHQMLTYALENGFDILETNSANLNKIQYNLDRYHFELYAKRVGVSSTTGNTSQALVKTIDESYDVYNYTINTDLPANSINIQKQLQKQAKRDEKGKKKSKVSDLMY
ncbi:MAG: hypothetical protein R3Y50_06225 [Rikenellaceae bacterium]